MTKEFFYNNTPVLFNQGKSVFINATQMSKPFNKTTKDWLRTDSSKNFINSLSAVRHIRPSELINIRRGGDVQGTWMHEDVALEFARWLSPEFAIWCNDRIKELLTKGYAKLDSISRKDLAQMLLSSEIEKEKANKRIEACTTQLKIQQPKVKFFDQVVKSNGLLELNQAAKLIGIGRNNMCARLRELKVFFKGTQPYQVY